MCLAQVLLSLRIPAWALELVNNTWGQQIAGYVQIRVLGMKVLQSNDKVEMKTEGWDFSPQTQVQSVSSLCD